MPGHQLMAIAGSSQGQTGGPFERSDWWGRALFEPIMKQPPGAAREERRFSYNLDQARVGQVDADQSRQAHPSREVRNNAGPLLADCVEKLPHA